MQTIQQIDPFETTRKKLESWAHWIRQGGLNLGAKNIFHNLVKSTTKRINTNHITDDDALLLDYAIASLIKKDPETGNTLKAYFISSCNYSLVSRTLNISRHKAMSLVNSGVAWIDAFLEGNKEKA